MAFLDDLYAKYKVLLGGSVALDRLSLTDIQDRYLTQLGYTSGAYLDKLGRFATAQGISPLRVPSFLVASTAPVISGAFTPVVAGNPVSYTPGISGGTGTKTWAIVLGSLPAWASFNTATGAITGTTATPGDIATTDVSLQATDALLLKSNVLVVSIQITA